MTDGAKTGEPEKKSVGRILSLDLLRCFAILLVIGHHFQGTFQGLPPVIERFFECWRVGGWMGVDLFFVLSGFLIAGLLFREHQKSGTISLKRFFIRRGFRIYPALWFLLGLTTLLEIYSLQPGDSWAKRIWHPLIGEFFFFTNYNRAWALWTQTWSLAVEEHFYLLLPTLLLGLIWLRRKKLNVFAPFPMVFGLVAVSCFLMRYRVNKLFNFSIVTHVFPTHLRMDALFFGSFLAYLMYVKQIDYKRLPSWARWPLVFVGCLLLAPAFIYPLHQVAPIRTYGFSLFSLGSGTLLIALLGWNPSKMSRWLVVPLAAIGARSYSIYLWHVAAQDYVNQLGKIIFGAKWAWPWTGILYLFGAIAVGILLDMLIETPMLKLRDLLFPSLIGEQVSITIKTEGWIVRFFRKIGKIGKANIRNQDELIRGQGPSP